MSCPKLSPLRENRFRQTLTIKIGLHVKELRQCGSHSNHCNTTANGQHDSFLDILIAVLHLKVDIALHSTAHWPNKLIRAMAFACASASSIDGQTDEVPSPIIYLCDSFSSASLLHRSLESDLFLQLNLSPCWTCLIHLGSVVLLECPYYLVLARKLLEWNRLWRP